MFIASKETGSIRKETSKEEMKTKASGYDCVVCKKNRANTWHHLILPGRGIARKENDNYAMPVCGTGEGWDGLCHDKCQKNEISLQLQGLILLKFKGADINLIIANRLTVGDVTEILRDELGR